MGTVGLLVFWVTQGFGGILGFYLHSHELIITKDSIKNQFSSAIFILPSKRLQTCLIVVKMSSMKAGRLSSANPD